MGRGETVPQFRRDWHRWVRTGAASVAPSPRGRGLGWAARNDMGNTMRNDMGNTLHTQFHMRGFGSGAPGGHRIGIGSGLASAASRTRADANALRADLVERVPQWFLTTPRTPGRTHSSCIGLPEFPDQKPGKVHFPDQRPALAFESHGIASKRFSHEPFASPPLDLTIAPDTSYLPVARIHEPCLAGSFRPRPIYLRGCLLAQSLVRTNRIVDFGPLIGAALLRLPMRRCRPGNLGFHYPVHLFVTCILLRMARRDEFHPNPQRCPPGAELGQPGRPGGAEGTAVVHSDNRGVSVLVEQSQEDPADPFPTLVSEYSDSQQIATEQVPNRQRLRPFSISSPEPTLEVHRPNLVASPGQAQNSPRQLRTTARPPGSPTLQVQSAQPVVDGPGRWHHLSRMVSPQCRSQLPTAPTAMLAVQLSDPDQPSTRKLLRGSPWPTTPLSQPLNPFGLEAVSPLVASTPTDAEQPTQSRHALAGLQSQFYKLKPSRQRIDLFPRHTRGNR